jgi:hypothetical protein
MGHEPHGGQEYANGDHDHAAKLDCHVAAQDLQLGLERSELGSNLVSRDPRPACKSVLVTGFAPINASARADAAPAATGGASPAS